MWWGRMFQRGGHSSPTCEGPAKWLPVIDTGACTGCGVCIEACEHQCLGMAAWSFAVLERPEACHSDGACRDACPHEVIRMDWVPMTAPSASGIWRHTGLAATPHPL